MKGYLKLLDIAKAIISSYGVGSPYRTLMLSAARRLVGENALQP